MRSSALVFTAVAMGQRMAALLLLPFVTRAMSVEDYGAATMLTSVTALVSAAVSGPVEQATFRAAARAGDGSDPMLMAAYRWLIVIAPIACAGAAVALWFVPGSFLQVSNQLWSVELVATAFVLFPAAYALAYFRAHRLLARFVAVAALQIGGMVIGKVLLVVIIPLGVAGWAVSDLIAGVLFFAASVILCPRPTAPGHKPDWRGLARFGLPLVPHTVSFWAIASLSRPLMALNLSLTDIGRYSAAYSAASVCVLLLSEVNRAASVEYARETFPAPSPPLAKIMRIQLLLAVVVPALMCIFAPLMVRVVLPPAYSGIESLVAVLSVGALFWSLYAIALNFVVQTSGITTWSWLASLAGTATVAVGTLTLGAVLGPTGVAIASTLCYAVMAAVAHVIVRISKLRIDWRTGGLTPRWYVVAAIALVPAIASSFRYTEPATWWLLVTLSTCALAIATVMAFRPNASASA